MNRTFIYKSMLVVFMAFGVFMQPVKAVESQNTLQQIIQQIVDWYHSKFSSSSQDMAERIKKRVTKETLEKMNEGGFTKEVEGGGSRIDAWVKASSGNEKWFDTVYAEEIADELKRTLGFKVDSKEFADYVNKMPGDSIADRLDLAITKIKDAAYSQDMRPKELLNKISKLSELPADKVADLSFEEKMQVVKIANSKKSYYKKGNYDEYVDGAIKYVKEARLSSSATSDQDSGADFVISSGEDSSAGRGSEARSSLRQEEASERASTLEGEGAAEELRGFSRTAKNDLAEEARVREIEARSASEAIQHDSSSQQDDSPGTDDYTGEDWDSAVV